MKNKALITIMLLTVILSGCGERTIQDEQDSYDTYFVRIGSESGGSIVYDSRTGVQYWRSEGTYNYGTLTILLDADGNPLIYKGE